MPDHFGYRIRTDLLCRSFEGFEYDGITRLDTQTCWVRIVPESMGLGIIEMMCSHRLLLSCNCYEQNNVNELVGDSLHLQYRSCGCLPVLQASAGSRRRQKPGRSRTRRQRWDQPG